MKTKAVIFDLNGTVLSDEDEYGQAFKAVLASLGVKVETDYPHIGGIGVRENWPIFIKKYKIKTNKSVSQLAAETQKAYLGLISKISVKAGVLHFMRSLRKSGFKLALATSNDWFVVEEIFTKLHIDKYFDAVVTQEDVKKNKPDPEIFLLTAKKLEVSPLDCVVVEDSKAGVDAAKEAGMKVIGIARNSAHAKTLAEAGLIIKSFIKLSPEVLSEF